MTYSKRPYTRLHHVEVHTHDDGSHRVEAHVIHEPPPPDNKKVEHIAPYAPRDYPNKTVTMTADDHEEAGEHVRAILAAHRFEKGRKAAKETETEEMKEA